MPMQKPTKSGNILVTPVGHTHNSNFGTDPNVKVRGRSVVPTPMTFGK